LQEDNIRVLTRKLYLPDRRVSVLDGVRAVASTMMNNIFVRQRWCLLDNDNEYPAALPAARGQLAAGTSGDGILSSLSSKLRQLGVPVTALGAMSVRYPVSVTNGLHRYKQ
jgi:hypothetical protein